MHVKIFFIDEKNDKDEIQDRVCASYLTHFMFDEQSETICLRH